MVLLLTLKKGKGKTHIQNELQPFGNQLLHEIPPNLFDDYLVRPHFFQFPQVNIRGKEQDYG
jgi:hypothetical protein